MVLSPLNKLRVCFPYSLVQRYRMHKLRNILNKLPRRLKNSRDIIAWFEDDFPSAMECFTGSLEDLLCGLKFPATHRKSIRFHKSLR